MRNEDGARAGRQSTFGAVPGDHDRAPRGISRVDPVDVDADLSRCGPITGALLEVRTRMASTTTTDGAILRVTSHDVGRNAEVSLYGDRIERVKPRGRLSLSRANKDTEVTPIKAISSVQAKKSGIRTLVTVYASGNTIEFRIDHKEAGRFKDEVMKLVLGQGAPAMAAPDLANQIARLAELRAQGALSEEEFASAKKAALGL